MKKKMILVDVKNRNIRIVEADGLDDYYELIGCRCIDIVNRDIGGKRYEVICDDEGLFTDGPQVSAVNRAGQPMLVGNLLIAGQAEEGELTALTEEDIITINESIGMATSLAHPDPYPLIIGMNW